MLQKSSIHHTAPRAVSSGAHTRSTFCVALIRSIPRSPARQQRFVTMASTERVAVAYASALASLAESNEKLDVIHADIDRLSSILSETEGLAEFLGNPITEEGKKQSVLSTLCSESGFDQVTENFLKLVMEKGRAGFLNEMCDVFEEQYCKMTETLVATLTSAVQLDEAEQFEIANKLQDLSGAKNIKLKPVIDPGIIAGFTLEYGSTQIDLSVKGQLTKLSQQLIEGGTV